MKALLTSHCHTFVTNAQDRNTEHPKITYKFMHEKVQKCYGIKVYSRND